MVKIIQFVLKFKLYKTTYILEYEGVNVITYILAFGRQCLRGIEEIGHGRWTQISIEYVPSRTPIQIASHTQKYFLRMAKPKEDRKRKSIHDTPYHLHLPNAADAHAHQQQQ